MGRALEVALQELGLNVDAYQRPMFARDVVEIRDLKRHCVIMEVNPAMAHAGRLSRRQDFMQSIFDGCQRYAELIDIWEGRKGVVWA